MPVGRRARSIAIGVVAGAVSALGPGGQAAATEGQTPVGDVRRVVFVGNNWAGTADVLAPGTFRRLGRINMIPDHDERMQEIATNPERLAYFLAIREAIGEGNDQFVDDMYSSNDGRLMIVSRPSFADVVAISLETGEIVWRFPVAGQRSDHMAISPDGKRGRGQRLDRQRGARAAGRRRQGARPVPVRRVAPRERLHRRRRADHPRQHRHGLHAARPAAGRTPPRASGCCRSSTPTPSRWCAATTCARRSTSAGSRTSAPPYAR